MFICRIEPCLCLCTDKTITLHQFPRLKVNISGWLQLVKPETRKLLRGV